MSSRIAEIENLTIFENSFVVFEESTGYGSNFPSWTRHTEYFEGDIVLGIGRKLYVASKDSKDKNPEESPNEWKLIPWTHPYFFLRDTAKVEDLRKLLTYKQPYVKTYSFAALAHRRIDGLFQVILDNLKDSTTITQMTGDYGYDVCPADLMISYKLDDLTPDERIQLKNLIESKYKHLKDALKLLTGR